MSLYRVQRFEVVDSTNNVIKRACEQGEPEGLVCRALEQTGGYGRQGRAWSSPRGGSYQSLLLRPNVPVAQLPTLGLIAALAVREALLKVGCLEDASISVKWPNDVVCAAGKLAGISNELHAGGICLGIGVNVMRPAATDAVSGKNIPAYLAELTNALPSDTYEAIDTVGDAVLSAFEERYALWQREGFAVFASEFNNASSLNGQAVDVVDMGGALLASGTVDGVDDQGRLVVDGIPVSSGEAHIA